MRFFCIVALPFFAVQIATAVDGTWNWQTTHVLPGDENLDPKKEADRMVSALARNGMDPKFLEINRKSFLKGLERQRMGFQTAGKTEIQVGGANLRITTLSPAMNGPSTSSTATELLIDNTAVQGVAGVGHWMVESKDWIAVLGRPSDLLFLANHGGRPAKTVESPTPDGGRKVVRTYAHVGRSDEIVEAVYDKSGRLASGSLFYQRDNGPRRHIAGYKVLKHRSSGGEFLPSVVEVQRLRPNGKASRIERHTFESFRTSAPPSLRESIGLGSTIIDARLGEGQSVSYKWTGSLPSVASLRQMARRDDLVNATPQYAAIIGGLTLFGEESGFESECVGQQS